MNDPVDLAVIGLMALATYACRSIGYLIMGWVPLTPRVRRGLEALPGAVIVSIVLPGALAAGLAGVAGVAAAVATMLTTRRDILALLAGCGAAAAVRLTGI